MVVIAVLGSAAGLCSAADLGDVFSQLQPTGSIRADYFRSSNRFDNETDLLGTTAQAKLLPNFNRWLEAKVEARFSSPDLRDGKAAGKLIEGFATIHFAKADLRLGKQIVAWGRADGINPTDNLTPRDYTVLLPFEDDQRLGTTSARLDVYLTEQDTLTLFTTPWFEPGRLPLPVGFSELPHATPARRLSNEEIGVRLNRVGEGLDWSLSYFNGFSLLPTFQLPAAGETLLAQHHDRIEVFGADVARNFGRFGVRGEAAYIDTPDRRGVAPFARAPQVYWVLGVDRTFFDNLNVNVQYFERRVMRFHAPDPAAPVSIFNAFLTGELDRVGNGMSCRVSDKWLHDTLEAELFALVNLNHGDAFARPSVTYDLSDHWKVTLGAELFSGPALTLFGSQKPNRGFFSEIRWSF